jgi:hypothetical protein
MGLSRYVSSCRLAGLSIFRVAFVRRFIPTSRLFTCSVFFSLTVQFTGMILLVLFVSAAFGSDALNLSRYLQNPQLAKNLSRVTLPAPFQTLESYSGLFEIRPQAYTFFWFFPHPNPNAPVVTWNQGDARNRISHLWNVSGFFAMIVEIETWFCCSWNLLNCFL